MGGINLSRADLSGAALDYSDLTSANLSGANLTGAFLYKANLTNTNLSSANVSGVTWTSEPPNLATPGTTDDTWSNTTCPDGTNSSAASPQTCVGHGI
jgi:uncharacterized protein YjbI with pentapeptide repeats